MGGIYIALKGRVTATPHAPQLVCSQGHGTRLCYVPRPQEETLSSHHDRKSCSLKQGDPINNRDASQRQPGIQLRKQSAKSAKTQGKLAITADKSKSSMPQQTHSGRQVQRPKRYED